jgi:tetratricopeptide (TPR) repeat protein
MKAEQSTKHVKKAREEAEDEQATKEAEEQAEDRAAAGSHGGNSPAKQTQLYEESKKDRVTTLAQGNKKKKRQKQREEMLARWEVKHAEESEEERKERVVVLSKIEIRYREAREKRAEINEEQDEEETALKEKFKEQKGSTKTLEEEEEAKIQRKVHQENAGKILHCTEGNDVVKFNLESFDPKDPHTGRMEGQYAGNHFELAITLFGFTQLLSIALWDTYERDETNFWDEKMKVCWNTGPLNGYDVCQHVKEYLQKIGKLHQSLLEVIMEGKVEELKCLQTHVGLADAFFSHMQALPIATMLETLKDAETRFAKELGTAPKFFIDYCGIRQCVSSDFTLERVVSAIETIGTTVVELDADVLGPDALLRRAFCVLESFATIKAKGVLLVCGPGLQDPAQMLKLAELASDSVECKAVMDSLTAKCRWEEEAINIKAYIQRTVGFARTDKVVLGAIVRCILGSAESVFAARADGGASVLGAIGWMVFETGDYAAALGLLEEALAKGEAAYGAEAAEIADTVYRIGMCRNEMVNGKQIEYFERDLRIQAEAHGSEEHASTARSLVGMGKRHVSDGDPAKGVECCERAIRRIQAATHPEDYADDHAEALKQIGLAHFLKQDRIDALDEKWSTMSAKQREEIDDAHIVKKEWRACLEWCRRSVEVRAAKHGPDHALAAAALGNMATAHGQLGDPEQAMALQLRVLAMHHGAGAGAAEPGGWDNVQQHRSGLLRHRCR